MHNILIVDDESKVREFIGLYFRANGFNVIEAENGMDALEKINHNDISLMVLDVLMPGLDGFQVCQAVRKISDLPIIILTALNEDEQYIKGYDVGADDYVAKGVNPKIIVAKAQRLLSKQGSSEVIQVGDLSIDPASFTVTVQGKIINNFAPKEFNLLLLLAQNEGKVLSREYILDRIWNYDFYGDTRVVDTHIMKIRKKLGCCSYMIKTIVSFGYKLER